MNRPSWEFDRIRTCVNKSHNLAPEPLGHKLHIVAPEGVEPSLAEPKPAVLPLYHRAVNRWGGRTRTYEAERRQIYSLLSLPLENTPILKKKKKKVELNHVLRIFSPAHTPSLPKLPDLLPQMDSNHHLQIQNLTC